MIGYWNDEEDAALQGLSLEAQIIYLRGIRRFADKNGVAGIERRINRASLSEVCHFLPDRRSPRAESRPTWDSVKHRLAELERAGLIVRLENLVFQLPYASQDNSVRMKTAGRRPAMTAPKTARKTTPNEPLAHNGFNSEDDTQDGPQDDTPQTVVDGTTSPVTIKTPLPPSGEDEIPSAWKADTRTMKPMSLDWTPDTNTLNAYLHGKAANGRPVTAADISARLDDWRENANASGKVMTDAQWTLRLIKYVMTCMSGDGPPVNHRHPVNQPDPLAFTEENRPKHGPYALLKPEPKKTPLDEEGRKRIEALKQQLFGPRTAA